LASIAAADGKNNQPSDPHASIAERVSRHGRLTQATHQTWRSQISDICPNSHHGAIGSMSSPNFGQQPRTKFASNCSSMTQQSASKRLTPQRWRVIDPFYHRFRRPAFMTIEPAAIGSELDNALARGPGEKSSCVVCGCREGR
jgi:hypothetical protein